MGRRVPAGSPAEARNGGYRRVFGERLAWSGALCIDGGSCQAGTGLQAHSRGVPPHDEDAPKRAPESNLVDPGRKLIRLEESLCKFIYFVYL